MQSQGVTNALPAKSDMLNKPVYHAHGWPLKVPFHETGSAIAVVQYFGDETKSNLPVTWVLYRQFLIGSNPTWSCIYAG